MSGKGAGDGRRAAFGHEQHGARAGAGQRGGFGNGRQAEQRLDMLRGTRRSRCDALQHRAVDLFVEIELTRSAIDRAVRTLDATDDPRERALAASACKARASESALHVVREAIQMHGAIGYTDEHDIGLYVRRALVLSAWLGNAGAHRRRYATLAPAPDVARLPTSS